MSVHLSDFVDFINIFIKYRSKQRTLKLSVMATKMVSTMDLFLIKKLFFIFYVSKFFSCLYFILYWLNQLTTLPEIQE